MNIPYSQAKGLIKEADVLLFKANKFPGAGWWISKYTKSIYSHAALAHWENGELYALEFKEFQGGRQCLMDAYVEKAASRGIAIFRANETIIAPYIEKINGNYWLAYKEFRFDADTACGITTTAIKLIHDIGRYSYWTIWQMFKTYIPFIRLRTKVVKNGEPDTKNFVCSTLVTYCYRKHFLDPVPNLSDEYTSPGDLARSGLFSQLFIIIN